MLVVVLQVRRILLSSNTSSKANYGLCAETGKTAAAMTNFSGFTKSTELLTAVIFGRFAAVFFFFFFFNRQYFRTFLKSPVSKYGQNITVGSSAQTSLEIYQQASKQPTNVSLVHVLPQHSPHPIGSVHLHGSRRSGNCLLVGCLTSQQHASVSQGRICSDNFTCCHTEIEAADQTFRLTQSQYTDTGPTSPGADPITPGAWQGSHWSANF